MSKDLTLFSFWAINDALEIKKLRDQLLEMKRLELDGVIFQPRFYPGNPEYLSKAYLDILSEIISYAKELDMEFWIYDENGWPSGTASGKVLNLNPDAKCMWLEYQEDEIQYKEKNAISTLDPKVCQDFIQITFEGYKKGLSKEAFDHVIGFFSDEVGFLDGHGASLEYGGVPWSEELPRLYQEKYGEDITQNLKLLFIEGDGYESVRANYWELITDILAEYFYKPINEWCQAQGKSYTAHVKGEENIFFQIPYSGSCYQILKNVSVPAIDALERYPGNHYYPRIASSISKQFYKGDCLCEAMGGSGWGVKPETFINYMNWLVEAGVNKFAFHLAQYSLNAMAIRDWPPSIPFHLSWKEAFPEVLKKIRSYAKTLKEREKNNERILIVAPTRGVMRQFDPMDVEKMNVHNGDGVPDTRGGLISNKFNKFVEMCYESGLQYDVTEERILEESGIIDAEGIRIGNVTYTKVLIGEGCCWKDAHIMGKLMDFQIPIPSKALNLACSDKCIEHVSNEMNDLKRWHVKSLGENQILLEFIKNKEGILSTEIVIENRELFSDMQLVTSDHVEMVEVEGHRLVGLINDNQMSFNIPISSILSNAIRISIQPKTEGETEPFAFLKGEFLVMSGDLYQIKDDHQISTRGPFILIPATHLINPENLIREGCPFKFTQVTVEKEIELSSAIKEICFTDLYADAIKVWIDGKYLGWFFTFNATTMVSEVLEPGKHKIKVELYPSTYNMYGPHHHIDGDRYLTSPDQYRGVKNFADYSESPHFTLVPEYHFVKFGIGNKVIFHY